jgi:choline dehydrogenase
VDSDFVIVGSGSAGAVLANRLSSDPTVRVTVLEAGPRDNDKFVHIPAGFAKLFRSPRDWDYRTEPQKELDGREIYWPRGKMLGGSSSINAMMWVRGFAADYDEWGEIAGDQWSFARLLPYFARIESHPLVISPQRDPRSSTAAFLKAVQQSGFPIERANDDAPEGFCQTMVTQRRGRRWSCADAYLKPVRRRPNLRVMTGALARRILFEPGRAENGDIRPRAVGVEFERDGRRQVVRASREVVLSCGAINSPQLLMLSGVGDPSELKPHGVDVVHEAPDVGKNLRDHLAVPLGFEVRDDTLFAAEKPLQLLKYLLRRRGMLTSNVGEAYGFVRSRPDLALPDLEMIFAPAPFFDEGLTEPDRHAVVLGPILLRPFSRGTVSLASADPSAKPVIDPQYLSDPDGNDRSAMMSGLRIAAEIAEAPALKQLLGRILRPAGATDTGDETLEEALTRCSQTLYHPVGTCRMGTDPASVVDPDLRVRGVGALRVADASVMPTIIRGHTHAPAVLIGEKAADLIVTS